VPFVGSGASQQPLCFLELEVDLFGGRTLGK